MPDPAVCIDLSGLPAGVTVERTQAIMDKPVDDWTEDDVEYMRRTVEWGAMFAQRVVEVLTPVVTAVIERVSDGIAEMAEAGWLPPPVTECPGDTLTRMVERGMPPAADTPISADAYRHVPGLPGISDRCWADQWTPDPRCGVVRICATDPCEEHGSYRPCGAEATSIAGTCAAHKL